MNNSTKRTCPFCGFADVDIVHVLEDSSIGHGYWNAHCKKCHCIGPMMLTKEGAERAGNTRNGHKRRTAEELVESFKKAFGTVRVEE